MRFCFVFFLTFWKLLFLLLLCVWGLKSIKTKEILLLNVKNWTLTKIFFFTNFSLSGNYYFFITFLSLRFVINKKKITLKSEKNEHLQISHSQKSLYLCPLIKNPHLRQKKAHYFTKITYLSIYLFIHLFLFQRDANIEITLRKSPRYLFIYFFSFIYLSIPKSRTTERDTPDKIVLQCFVYFKQQITHDGVQS